MFASTGHAARGNFNPEPHGRNKFRCYTIICVHPRSSAAELSFSFPGDRRLATAKILNDADLISRRAELMASEELLELLYHFVRHLLGVSFFHQLVSSAGNG